jgi:hypothetical protein
MIARLREWLCQRLCGDRLWNKDLSLELDTWIDAYESCCADNEVLCQRIRDMEVANGR